MALGGELRDWRALLEGVRLPAAIVDLDAFDRNLVKMGELASTGGKSLRVATKSLRVPGLIQRVLARGRPFLGVMAYSAEECDFLAERGISDFLLAYPTVQASDIEALHRTVRRGVRLRMVVDSQPHLETLRERWPANGPPLELVIEADASWRPFGGAVHVGVRRSPVRSAQALATLADAIAREPKFRFAGAMVYEAQIAGLGDRSRFKRWLNPAKGWIRRISRRKVANLRAEIAHGFATSPSSLLLNGGGTGSLNWAAAEPGVTEVTAGSGLYQTTLFDAYSNIQFEPSLFFALQSVRHSDAGWVTAQGGGYVASGEPGWDRVPLPVWPEGLRLSTTEGTGEVQTPLRGAHATTIGLGDPIVFRPAKAGETLERFNEVILISQGKVTDRLPTYRGCGRCFF